LLLALFFVNSLGRTLDGIRPGRWISPFWYYDRTNAVAPGGSFDALSTLGVAAAAVVIALLAAAAFARRDLGAALVRRTPRTGPAVLTPSRNPMLRTALSESLYEHRAGLFFWCLGIALLALFMTSLVKTLVEIVSTNPVLKQYLTGQHGDLARAAVSAFWFGTLPLLLAVYAITQVSRWTSEDGDGRLEMTLSQPMPRWRVVLERAGALLTGTALIVAAGSVATWLGSAAQGIALGGAGPILRASLLMLPFGLAFGAVGAALAGAIPRATVLLLSALAVASYFLDQFAPLFRWPAWVRDLSIFHLYGTPLTSGVYWTGLWALLAVILVGTTIGVMNMAHRDVGR
jgi:ABC-2 type transport system permease protein